MVIIFNDFALVGSNVLCSIQLVYVNADIFWLIDGDKMQIKRGLCLLILDITSFAIISAPLNEILGKLR